MVQQHFIGTLFFFFFPLLLHAQSSELQVGEEKQEANADLQSGLYYYYQYDLENALHHFRLAVAEDSTSADAHAWLADIHRRIQQPDSAELHARTALAIAPCHVFAHQIVADLYNPQFGGGSIDTVVNHLDRALACDSTDGDLMMDLWIEGMRRGDRVLERYALTTMVRTGYMTPGALAYARWVLGTLPPNAILLTNGDMDTYPVVALQETGGFRNDVIVINMSLMNLPWYARLIRDRNDLPLLFDDAALDTLSWVPSSEGRYFDPGQQIVARWFGASYSEDLESEEGRKVARHPIAVSSTIDAMLYPVFDPAAPYFTGPHWTHEPNAASELDTTTMRTGLASVNIEDFRGPFLSPQDRSPLRRMGQDYPLLLQTALAYGNAMIQAGRLDEARRISEWAERFIEASGTGRDALEYVREMRENVGEDGR